MRKAEDAHLGQNGKNINLFFAVPFGKGVAAAGRGQQLFMIETVFFQEAGQKVFHMLVGIIFPIDILIGEAEKAFDAGGAHHADFMTRIAEASVPVSQIGQKLLLCNASDFRFVLDKVVIVFLHVSRSEAADRIGSFVKGEVGDIGQPLVFGMVEKKLDFPGKHTPVDKILGDPERPVEVQEHLPDGGDFVFTEEFSDDGGIIIVNKKHGLAGGTAFGQDLDEVHRLPEGGVFAVNVAVQPVLEYRLPVVVEQKVRQILRRVGAGGGKVQLYHALLRNGDVHGAHGQVFKKLRMSFRKHVVQGVQKHGFAEAEGPGQHFKFGMGLIKLGDVGGFIHIGGRAGYQVFEYFVAG